MKKVMFTIALIAVFFSPLFPNLAKADSKSPATPIELINQFLEKEGEKPLSESEFQKKLEKATDKVTEKANRLEGKGVKEYNVKVPLDKDKPLLGEVEIGSEPTNDTNKGIGTHALRAKNWNKYYKYRALKGAIQFKITNRGTFTYGKRGKYHVVGGVTATVDSACSAGFSCTEFRTIDRLDASVVMINGKATYSGGFKGGPVTYHGYLDIEVNGTGNVWVKRAKFSM